MYWDAHRGEYMTPNRMFNPRTGRWTQPDPFWGLHNMQNCVWSILQAGNLFMYALHNPVRWIDPLGLAIMLARNATDEQRAQYDRAITYLRQSETFRELYNSLQNAGL